MNKQELIDILENLECSTESLSYDNGYEQGVYDSLSHVILLDEPKKVVVPPMIAKFIRESDDPIYEICTWADYYGNDGRTCEDSKLSAVINWYGKNSNEFYRAVINGYEVKEEPLYYVDFINNGDVHKRLVLDHENGKHNIVDWSDNLIGLVQEMFTEKEIKAVDERYWLFKEEVKEDE
ncbi:DUF1642 domain-containing protein [Enterococcus faecalis]|uniref:DUF1642 domain-containing protein n=1 Tax=Enterococcus faecalis TaxID=1351 RepID=UPI0040415228